MWSPRGPHVGGAGGLWSEEVTCMGEGGLAWRPHSGSRRPDMRTTRPDGRGRPRAPPPIHAQTIERVTLSRHADHPACRVDAAHPHTSHRTDHPGPTCGSPCMMGVGHPGQNDGRVDATAHTRPMYRADARLFHIRGTGPQPIAVKQFGFNDNPRRPGSSTSSSSRTVVSHAIVPHSSRQHCRMRPWCPHALACHPHFSHVRHPIVRIEHITGVSSVSSCTRLHAYAHRAQSGPLHVRFTQSGHHWLRHPKTPP